MADNDDLFFKPDIAQPLRDRVPVPDSVVEDLAALADERFALPDADRIDPFTAMQNRFQDLKDKAFKLKERATVMLDVTLEDVDGYVGTVPPIVLKYIEELTGISFAGAGSTDSIFTLPPDIIKCIFRIAGYYDPQSKETSLAEKLKSWDSNELRNYVDEQLHPSYFESILYGMKLLVTVLKMSYVISIHYSVGYICGWFKGKLTIGKKWKVAGTEFGFEIALGDKIAAIFHAAEERMLALIGYRCDGENESPVNCNEVWTGEETDFYRIPCCTMDPIFFDSNIQGERVFNMSRCFESWIRQEIGDTTSRNICSLANASDTSLEPTAEEKAKAQVVAEVLAENGSATGVMNTADIQPLSAAIEAANAGGVMSSQVQSSLDDARAYTYRGRKTAPWDCFGMGLENDERARIAQVPQQPAGTGDLPILERGQYLFEYLQGMDEAITAALEFADKIVIGTANLAKWGSSRQLCCYVYLLILICTTVYRLIKTNGAFCSERYVECPKCKGKGCPTCNNTGRLAESQAFADAMRDEFRWAASLRSTGAITQTVKMLQVIKMIVDLFCRKMQRSVFLAGLKLPLGEMWALIKVTISNGLSTFLDIIFAPFDSVISGIKSIPEIRHMINNECFGFNTFLDFLSCLLGNLKFGILNEVMKWLDFTINDLVIINDIYLSRTRLSFLESLSRLLNNMLNLILGLRDCYDPQILIDQILKEQLQDQYNNIQLYTAVVGDRIAQIDEYCESLMGQEPGFSEEEAQAIDGLAGSISASLSGIGHEAIVIMTREIRSPGTEQISMTEFVDETGNVVDLGRVNEIIEARTGVTMAQTREGLTTLMKILEGEA